MAADFSDEIAGAIVNARAFEEIEHLRAQLELPEHLPGGGGPRGACVWGHRRAAPGHAAAAAADRNGSADRCHGVDSGRIRHRQRTGGARTAPAEPAQRAPADPGQLRLGSGRAIRK